MLFFSSLLPLPGWTCQLRSCDTEVNTLFSLLFLMSYLFFPFVFSFLFWSYLFLSFLFLYFCFVLSFQHSRCVSYWVVVVRMNPLARPNIEIAHYCCMFCLVFCSKHRSLGFGVLLFQNLLSLKTVSHVRIFEAYVLVLLLLVTRACIWHPPIVQSCICALFWPLPWLSSACSCQI